MTHLGEWAVVIGKFVRRIVVKKSTTEKESFKQWLWNYIIGVLTVGIVLGLIFYLTLYSNYDTTGL